MQKSLPLQGMKRLFLSVIALSVASLISDACTSAIVAASRSATGRPILWKNRDTGADNNFLARVEPTDSTFGFIGLFNAGDSTLSEAWMGMNDVGFAIMNTASYNLAPDTATFKDREGVVMAAALARCRTVADFEQLLAEWPRPMGVQANFGVIDACGGAAYFETDDYEWTRFDVADDSRGYIVRTNFSVTGRAGEGFGYIRYNAAEHLIEQATEIVPQLFVEGLSCSYYHGLTGHDYLAEGERYVADRDFIPRDITTASIAIEGVNSEADADSMTMWVALGYPPCAPLYKVEGCEIPAKLAPSGAGYRSEACDESMRLRDAARPFAGGSGSNYLDLDKIRDCIRRFK